MSSPIIYKWFPLLFLLCLLSCGDRKAQLVKEKRTPNIIYILADDLGYGDIGAFNPQGKIHTPHIDQLASSGIKFTDAHSPSAVCSPTRYGILTGRYSWRSELKSGVLTGKSRALIPKTRKTVASLLKESGYETAFIGKWHLGWDWSLKDSTDFGGEGWNPEDFGNIDFDQAIKNTPNDLGFDYAYGHSGSLDMAPYVYVENGYTTAAVDHLTEDTGKYTWWRKGPTASDFVHGEVTPNFFGKAIDFIDARSTGQAPFFLYLALPSPHTPILPTKDFLGKSGLNPYADFVMMIDAYVGDLVKALDHQGLSENTIIIFTSDNGCSPEADFELLGSKGHDPSGNLRGHKADIFEGGHRIPFILKWPAVVAPNSISDKTINLTDLMATCAELTNRPLAPDEGEDSYSLLPILDMDPTKPYQREATVHHSINGSFALRKGYWKLIFCPDSGGWSDPKPQSEEVAKLEPFQLYNLANDLKEQENQYAKHPEIVIELKQIMASYINNGRSTPGEQQTNSALHLNGDKWGQIEKIIVN